MNARPFALLLTLAVGLALPAFANNRDETRRDNVIETFDINKSGRLEKDELKSFKSARPVMYENLMDFCKTAKKNPASHGVKFHANQNPKKVKCSKKSVYNPYLEAWAAQGAPVSGNHP